MRILGIDPGLHTASFGVIDVQGQRIAYMVSGIVYAPLAALGDLSGRVKILFDGVGAVAQR